MFGCGGTSVTIVTNISPTTHIVKPSKIDNSKLEALEVFPWNPNFETGIVEIDAQHQQLVHLLNRLAAHLAQESEPVVLEQVFSELAAYADFHFKEEEKIWVEHFGEDEWFTGHSHTHEKFLERVNELRSQEQNSHIHETVDELIKFLTHWLAFHILDNDMRMAKAIASLKSGATLEQAKEHAIIEMSGIMRVFTASVLAMYDKLTSRTIELVREREHRIRMEKELLELSERVKENEKREIYVSILNASHHILNNLLNQLLLFKIEAERSLDFDKNILRQFNDAFSEAYNHVNNLANISDLSSKSIKKSIDSSN